MDRCRSSGILVLKANAIRNDDDDEVVNGAAMDHDDEHPNGSNDKHRSDDDGLNDAMNYDVTVTPNPIFPDPIR